jgi:hypothetical protein
MTAPPNSRQLQTAYLILLVKFQFDLFNELTEWNLVNPKRINQQIYRYLDIYHKAISTTRPVVELYQILFRKHSVSG